MIAPATRFPLQPLTMATQRPTRKTGRRPIFDPDAMTFDDDNDDDYDQALPAAKRAKKDVNVKSGLGRHAAAAATAAVGDAFPSGDGSADTAGSVAVKRKPQRTGKSGKSTDEAQIRSLKQMNSMDGQLMQAVLAPSYEEEDDGFVFARTRTTRTKLTLPTALSSSPSRDADGPSTPAKAVSLGRRKKTFSTPAHATEKDAIKTARPTRASSRLSGGTSDDATTTTAAPPPPRGRKPGRPKTVATAAAAAAAAENGMPRTTGRRAAGEATKSKAAAAAAAASAAGRSPPPTPRDATRIAIPFADTPVQRRNKEYRKQGTPGQRRSSFGMRGRRASSLMDSGSSGLSSSIPGWHMISITMIVVLQSADINDLVTAIPHGTVDTTEFYKHISEDVPEPRRMRQLLTWCAERALGDKPSYSTADGNARLAARVIQEDLVKAFANRSDMSNWFNRDIQPAATIVQKPNPRNITNAEKILELEAQLDRDMDGRLKSERQAWETLAPSPPIPPPPSITPASMPTSSSLSSQSQPSQPPPPTSSTMTISAPPTSTLSHLQQHDPTSTDPHSHHHNNQQHQHGQQEANNHKDQPSNTTPALTAPTKTTTTTTKTTTRTDSSSLLDPDQRTLHTTLTALPNLTPRIQQSLHDVARNLELNTDRFAHSLHSLRAYRQTADRVAVRALSLAADALQHRDDAGRRAAGTRQVPLQEVLRSLAALDR
ncbi:MAG: hypothetical protein M1825_002708 [Sarcosagium campestre]|nr:MAG: hypothetical protein M1825_002708 [Sarcosagium campestre]